MKELMKELGYVFMDQQLLKQALTHPSLNGKNNQRLEFLGDAVLEYAMSVSLYHAYPTLDEGGLTHLRANLVCQAALDKVARKIFLGRYLLLNKSQEVEGGRENPAILADAMEAVLGAICLDGGIEKAQETVARLWKGVQAQTLFNKDDKSQLQEWVQALGKEAPSYAIIEQVGPPHQRVFIAQVKLEGVKAGVGQGKSKRQAEQEAAKQALTRLKANQPTEE